MRFDFGGEACGFLEVLARSRNEGEFLSVA